MSHARPDTKGGNKGHIKQINAKKLGLENLSARRASNTEGRAAKGPPATPSHRIEPKAKNPKPSWGQRSKPAAVNQT